MTKQVTIALDAMGGDVGPDVVVPAALEILKKHQDVCITLVGDEAVLGAKYSSEIAQFESRCHIHHASQVVAMDEKASSALRGKKRLLYAGGFKPRQIQRSRCLCQCR